MGRQTRPSRWVSPGPGRSPPTSAFQHLYNRIRGIRAPGHWQTSSALQNSGSRLCTGTHKSALKNSFRKFSYIIMALAAKSSLKVPQIQVSFSCYIFKTHQGGLSTGQQIRGNLFDIGSHFCQSAFGGMYQFSDFGFRHGGGDIKKGACGGKYALLH
jgi:hypothetical protein